MVGRAAPWRFLAPGFGPQGMVVARRQWGIVGFRSNQMFSASCRGLPTASGCGSLWACRRLNRSKRRCQLCRWSSGCCSRSRCWIPCRPWARNGRSEWRPPRNSEGRIPPCRGRGCRGGAPTLRGGFAKAKRGFQGRIPVAELAGRFWRFSRPVSSALWWGPRRLRACAPGPGGWFGARRGDGGRWPAGRKFCTSALTGRAASYNLRGPGTRGCSSIG